VTNNLQLERNANMNIGITLTAEAAAAAAALLFQPWLAAVSVALGIAAAVYYVRANDIGAALWDVQAQLTGRQIIKIGTSAAFVNNYGEWTASREKLAEEWKILNVMYYGQETKPGTADGKLPPISYENFRKGLAELLKGEGREIGHDEAAAMYTLELFTAAGAGKGGTVQEAMNIMNTALESKKRGAGTDLDREERRLREEQEAAKKAYAEWLKGEQEITAGDREALGELARRASDTARSIEEREAAGAAYEELIGKLRAPAESVREEIREKAAAAWGAGTWNSEWHYKELIQSTAPGGLLGSRTGYGRSTEGYTELTEGELADLADLALRNAISLELSVREQEWELASEDFEKQYGAWEEQARELYAIAGAEWEKAKGSFNEGYNRWRQKFIGEYEAKTGEWEENYRKFVKAKQEWAEEQYVYAANVGNAGQLEQAGADAEAVIGQGLAELEVSRMGREEMDAGAYVTALLEGTQLGALMNFAGSIAGRGEGAGGRIRQGSRRATAAASLAAARGVLEKAAEDMRKGAAKLAAQ
jgi:hypothetical protein